MRCSLRLISLIAFLLVSAFCGSAQVISIDPNYAVSQFVSGLSHQNGVAYRPATNDFLVVEQNGVILRINASSGSVSTFATIPTSVPGGALDAIAINSKGQVFAPVYATGGPVLEFDANGNYLSNFPVPGFPQNAAVFDKNDNFYIALGPDGNSEHTIYEYTAASNYTSSFVFASGFSSVQALLFNASGQLFAADFGTGIVYQVTPGGMTAGSHTVWASGLTRPDCLAISPFDQSIFVGDYDTDKVTRITAPGVFSNFAAGSYRTTALAFDPAGDLFVSQDEAGIIWKFTRLGVAPLQIVPDNGGNTGTVTVRVSGQGLEAGATVTLTGSGSAIVGTNTTLLSPGILATTFDLTNAMSGVRNVVVVNPDATSVALPNAFTVNLGGAPQLSIDIIGLDRIRIGSSQSYYVIANNSGNVDSEPSIVSIVVPTSVAVVVDPSQSLLGNVTSGANSTLVFGVGVIHAGGRVTIPISVQTSSESATAPLLSRPAAITQAGPASFQLSAFLNLLAPTDLPVATEANFKSNLQCSFYATCDSQCASLYLRQVQAYDLAKFKFDVYVNQSTAQTAALGELGAKRIAIGAAYAEVGLAVGALVGEIGLASAGVPFAEAIESYIGGAVTHVIFETVAALKGDQQTNAQEAAAASLDVANASTDAATLLNLENSGTSVPIDAPVRAMAISSLVGGIQAAIDGVAADSDQYFSLGLDRRNAYDTFNTYAASFCRARDAVESCHLQTVASATPCGSPVIPPPPPSDGDDETTITITPVESLDPNDKVGPRGTGAAGYVAVLKEPSYSIYFGNDLTATAPAQMVTVTDTLDVRLFDPMLLTLGPINLGDKVVTPPLVPLANLGTYSTDVDLRPAIGLIVHIAVDLNQTTGVVRWVFSSIDPVTGQPPSDPLTGFLPAGQGGSVGFTIGTKSPVTGTQLANQANIIFDLNPPIATTVWTNTVDQASPTSKVNTLPAIELSPNFIVTWTGTDVGSGIRDFSIYFSDNGAPYVLWLGNVAATSATFAGQVSHTYSFYSIARDLVGNVEGSKTTAEAATTMSRLINVASGVQITSSGFLYSRTTRTFNGTITLINAGGYAISGPLQIGFGGLPASVTLANATTANGGIPFITLPGGIAPGQSVSFTVQFSNPSNLSISYSPIVYSGAF